MKISCQSCPAKYTIADEKVLGKVVKIRCKKCSSTIVINGNDAGAVAEMSGGMGGQSLSPAAAVTDLWTVNVAEGDQRTLSTEEVVAEFGSGIIHDETFCWKEGMADWLPLREIDELRQAVGLEDQGGTVDPNAGTADEHTLLDNGASLGALFGASNPTADVGGGLDAGHLFGDSHAAVGETAARRSKGRGDAGTDLFGGVSQAGAEEDQSTQLGAPAFPSASEEDVKLTGQRNESSVLFSLSALTSQEPNVQSSAAASSPTTTEGSGLIDIRALSAATTTRDKPTNASKVDDIMNLSGGGAFSAALAAPVLAAPTYSDTSSEGGGAKNNKLIFAIFGASALLAAAIFGGMVFVFQSSKPHDAGSGPLASASAVSTPNLPGEATGAIAAAPATSAAAPVASTTAASPVSPTAPKAPTVGAPAAAGGGGVKTTAKAPDPEPTPAPAPAPPPPPKDLGAALQEAAGQKPKPAPAAAAGTDAPFDRGAAAAALGGVNVQSCKKPDGPTGTGRVKVTFAPSGSVQTAVIDGAPFEGTPVGSCVAGKFRGARIPAFAGSAVTAGKSFTIN